MPIVSIKSGDGAGQVFELGDAPLVVGRDDRAEIQLHDQGVSRRHAEFFRIGEMYFIRDLQSRNGTFVNEDRVEEELLRDADEVRIASTVLLFEDRRAGSLSGRSGSRHRFRASPNADATTTIQVDDQIARDLTDLAEPVHQESRDLKHLYACSRAIAQAREPQQLSERLVRIACEAVSADHACVFLRSGQTREYELEASYQREENALHGLPVVATRVIVDVVRSKRAVLNQDTKVGPSPDPKASLLGLGRPASVVCAPLIAHDQVHGVLYCAALDPDRFSSRALELITSMGIQVGAAIQAMLLQQRQERILLATVRTLASLLEMRDRVYSGHSGRVSSYCALIAQALKIPRPEARRIQLAALLHNVSKIVLPRDEAGSETAPSVIKRRNALSEKLIRRIEGLEFVLPVITSYHERMDGRGLPRGLAGEKIPLAARLLAVADRFDTLLVRGDPPDYQPLSVRGALCAIRDETPDRFDARVVDALIVAHRAGALQAALPRRASEDPEETSAIVESSDG